MVECFHNFINLFTHEENDLVNLITITVAPAEVAHDICAMPDLGLAQNQKFVGEHIIDMTANFWGTVPQNKLKLCMT